MTTPANRRSVREIQEALRGLLPFYRVCLDSRSPGKPELRRSLVVSVSSECDPEGGEGAGGSRAWCSKAARLTGPARLNTPMTRLRRQAVTCGPVPVRT